MFAMHCSLARVTETLPLDMYSGLADLESNLPTFISSRCLSSYVTWGAVSWLMKFDGPHLLYEGELADLVFSLGVGTYFGGSLSMLPSSVRDATEQSKEPIFSTIASITLWCIWKGRCMHVLSHEPSPSEDTLRIIWSELIHTLRSGMLQRGVLGQQIS